MARAFFSDPLYVYLFPDEAERDRLLTWDLNHLIQYGIRFGEVYTTSTLSGCAVWLPPGETDFTEQRMREVGMLDSAAQIGADAEQRMLRFVSESEEFHRSIAFQPHWYLVLLGVDPPRQGGGIGSALLIPDLARADEGKLPVYLETANPGNLPFYEKRGFAVRAEAPLSDGGSTLWYMVRDPKP
jgi:GNAT superfamily N-acetyltransferase